MTGTSERTVDIVWKDDGTRTTVALDQGDWYMCEDILEDLGKVGDRASMASGGLTATKMGVWVHAALLRMARDGGEIGHTISPDFVVSRGQWTIDMESESVAEADPLAETAEGGDG